MSNIGDRIILKARRRIVEDRSDVIVVPDHRNHNSFRADVDLRELSLLESSNLNLITKKSFGKSTKLVTIIQSMKMEFNFPQDSDGRLWISNIPDPSSLRPVHGNFVRTLDEVGILQGGFSQYTDQQIIAF